ncbi:hypothetical protein BASA81_002176 [Batrachochytrium salamandrivorans]|nr:hypothetical protein BASA81_002176 [Batrachochytrium salamandrivorans]
MDVLVALGKLGLETGADISPILEKIYEQLDSFGYLERVWFWRPTCSRFIVEILQDEQLVRYHALAWYICHTSLELASRKNSSDASFEDIDTIAFAVNELRMLDLIASKLSAGGGEGEADIVVISVACLSLICLYPQFTQCVLTTRLAPLLVDQVRTRFPSYVAGGMLVVLANLALHDQARHSLIQAGIVQLGEELAPHLSSRNMDELDCALSISFCLCRLQLDDNGGEADGILIAKMDWILNEVVLAGPGGVVLRSKWNPANIVMDLAVLARKPENLVLVTPVLATVTAALDAYGRNNARLVSFTSQFVWELSFAPCAQSELATHRYKLVRSFTRALDYGAGDLMTRHYLVALVERLQGPGPGMVALVLDKLNELTRWVSWRFPEFFAARRRPIQ